MLNCKAGDLAVFIRSAAKNEGKIVTCLRLATMEEMIQNNVSMHLGPMWVIDKKVNSSFIFNELFFKKGPDIYLAYDFQLRAIRDQEGEDEILTIAGKPVKEMDTV